MNLVQNAIAALGDIKDPQVTLHHEIRGDHAVLLVSVDGPGIPAEIVGSIFDPFFTTKTVGKGTGPGLPTSHKITQELGGDLSYRRNDDGGSCFCLELPKGQGS